MRWLRISIFSLAVILVLWPGTLYPQRWSVRSGIYDFTDFTAREFYVIAPTVMAGFDFWQKSRLALQLSTGLSFNSVRYNSHRHFLYMVPLFLTLNYQLSDPGSRIVPVIGMGAGMMEKVDHNQSFDKTLYSFTYGYHATGGIRFRLEEKLWLTFDLTYNLMMPPVMEEVNLSGVIVTLGIRF